jgi:hypothetical protein
LNTPARARHEPHAVVSAEHESHAAASAADEAAVPPSGVVPHDVASAEEAPVASLSASEQQIEELVARIESIESELENADAEHLDGHPEGRSEWIESRVDEVERRVAAHSAAFNEALAQERVRFDEALVGERERIDGALEKVSDARRSAKREVKRAGKIEDRLRSELGSQARVAAEALESQLAQQAWQPAERYERVAAEPRAPAQPQFSDQAARIEDSLRSAAERLASAEQDRVERAQVEQPLPEQSQEHVHSVDAEPNSEERIQEAEHRLLDVLEQISDVESELERERPDYQ